ncbi:MAG: ISNCY family transposase [Bacteroidales bacterium]|nr:ISNCY family transposase [Bacteroidales bacterium]
MRKLIENKFNVGETPSLGIPLIENISFDIRSRDEVTKTLLGLQEIYKNEHIRKPVFSILEEMISESISKNKGRKGMSLWTIFVLGTLRLSCNWNYDNLKEHFDNHMLIRQMCGINLFLDGTKVTSLQTILDNVALFTEEISDKIAKIVVNYGHEILEKLDIELKARCDSFVCLSNSHYPTDFNLLLDVCRVLIRNCARIADAFNFSGWREHKSIYNKLKQKYNTLSKMRYSNSKDEDKKEKRKQIINKEIESYLFMAENLLNKVISFQEGIPSSINIQRTIDYGKLFVGQIRRRIFNDEKIPASEKVYSIFEPYTEWICKGKAGVRQELGVKVCIMEDQFGFILNHRVMNNEQDKDVAFAIVEDTKKLFVNLQSVSFDKGFHSKKDSNGKDNRSNIEEILNVTTCLPKKGKRNKFEDLVESSKEFGKARKQHPAIESAINALTTHGLDRCPDKGERNYKRYISMAVTAHNIHKLGAIMIEKELMLLKKKAA